MTSEILEKVQSQNPLKEKHQCQLPQEKSVLSEFCPGSDNYSYFKRRVLRFNSIDEESYNTKLHLKSSSVIKGEILRHILFHQWTIHSNSKFRFVILLFCIIFYIVLKQ